MTTSSPFLCGAANPMHCSGVRLTYSSTQTFWGFFLYTMISSTDFHLDSSQVIKWPILEVYFLSLKQSKSFPDFVFRTLVLLISSSDSYQEFPCIFLHSSFFQSYEVSTICYKTTQTLIFPLLSWCFEVVCRTNVDLIWQDFILNSMLMDCQNLMQKRSIKHQHVISSTVESCTVNINRGSCSWLLHLFSLKTLELLFPALCETLSELLEQLWLFIWLQPIAALSWWNDDLDYGFNIGQKFKIIWD